MHSLMAHNSIINTFTKYDTGSSNHARRVHTNNYRPAVLCLAFCANYFVIIKHMYMIVLFYISCITIMIYVVAIIKQPQIRYPVR